MAVLRPIAMAVCAAATLIAGCGGGDPPAAGPAVRGQAPQRAASLDANGLMDWAETHYAEYFPGHSASGMYDRYLYRAYSVAGKTNYLGVTSDGGIYVMGPDLTGGQIVPVGTLADFTCRVLSCGTSLTGTAAAGAPIAGATVTLSDSANRSVTAITSATGGYTFDTTGLSAPFLLQLTTPAGRRLYSVTADSAASKVANLTPLTDLIVRSWYAVQGTAADAAFADTVAAPAPSQQQAESVASAVLAVMQRPLSAANAAIASPLDLITRPFSANHTGLDGVLDQTSISYGTGATITIAGATVQQTSVLAYDTASGAITASSTTVSGANTSTSSVRTVVPLQTAQATALDEIAAMLRDFGGLVSVRRTALATGDLAPYFDPGLLHDGRDVRQYTAMLASVFNGGQSVSAAVQRLKSLDVAAGRAEAVVNFTHSLNGQSMVQGTTFVFRKVGGTWLFSGNQRIAQIEVQAEASMHQGATSGEGPLVNVSVLAPRDTVRSVSAAGTPGIIPLGQHSTVVDEGGMLLDQFNGEQGQLPGALPPAGTQYTVTLTKSDGASVSYVEAINAFTTEGVRITTPTGRTLADARPDETLNVAWGLPTTYAVASIRLSGTSYTGDMELSSTYRCETPWAITSATATSASLSIPGTCSGQAVRIVDLLLIVTGINGEHSETHYTFQ